MNRLLLTHLQASTGGSSLTSRRLAQARPSASEYAIARVRRRPRCVLAARSCSHMCLPLDFMFCKCLKNVKIHYMMAGTSAKQLGCNAAPLFLSLRGSRPFCVHVRHRISRLAFWHTITVQQPTTQCCPARHRTDACAMEAPSTSCTRISLQELPG